MIELKLKRQTTLLLAVVVLSLVGGDLAWSYVQGARWVVKNTLRESTSIEFDLARLDQAIEDLTPTLQSNRKTAAELEVEIEVLEEDTAEIDRQQMLAKAEMQHLRDALGSNSCNRTVRFDEREFTQAEVEAELSRRLSAYQQTDRHLQARRSLLAKQRQTFAQVEAAIRDNEHQQVSLMQTAEALNGELKLLEMSHATSSIALKHPNLGQAKELAKTIESRIRTLQKLSDHESQHAQAIPVNLDQRTAAQRFDATFSNTQMTAAKR